MRNTQGDKIVIVKYNGIVMSRTIDFAATDKGQDTLVLLVIPISLRCCATASYSHIQAENNHRFRGR